MEGNGEREGSDRETDRHVTQKKSEAGGRVSRANESPRHPKSLVGNTIQNSTQPTQGVRCCDRQTNRLTNRKTNDGFERNNRRMKLYWGGTCWQSVRAQQHSNFRNIEAQRYQRLSDRPCQSLDVGRESHRLNDPVTESCRMETQATVRSGVQTLKQMHREVIT